MTIQIWMDASISICSDVAVVEKMIVIKECAIPWNEVYEAKVWRLSFLGIGGKWKQDPSSLLRDGKGAT